MTMSTPLIFAFVLLVAAIAVSTRGRRWLRLTVAVLLFASQLFIVAISLDGAARSTMNRAIASGDVTPDFEKGVRSLKSELMPYRAALLVLGVGLLVITIRNVNQKSSSLTA